MAVVQYTVTHKQYTEQYNETEYTEQYIHDVKNKSSPWTGPEGSRRLRLPDFNTFGTLRWLGCEPHAPAAFTPLPSKNF